MKNIDEFWLWITIPFPSAPEISVNIFLSFQTLHVCDTVFPALMTTKIKFGSSLKKSEDILHPAVPNIQLRWSTSSKNKLYLSHWYGNLISSWIHGKSTCVLKDCFKLNFFIIIKIPNSFHAWMIESSDIKPVDRKVKLYTSWRSDCIMIFFETNFPHGLWNFLSS